jgi:hypothetical protein
VHGVDDPPETDTGGRAWTGRSLPVGEHSDDTGEPDVVLARALTARAAALAADAEVVAALGGARVLVPVVAVPPSGSPPGRRSDESVAGRRAAGPTEMAVVTLTGPDGLRVMPVFTGLGSLRRWDPAARPVPVQGRRAATSAVAEGCAGLVIDPAGPVTFVVSRPAVWALGQGRDWVPAHVDPAVLDELRTVAARQPVVRSVTAEAGVDPDLRVLVGLPEGLDAETVRALAWAISADLQASPVIRERAEGVSLRMVRSR